MYSRGGGPTHAATSALVGSDAVRELLTWRDVDARWVAGRSNPARTIIGRWEALMTSPSSFTDQHMLPLAIPRSSRTGAARADDILGAFLIRNGRSCGSGATLPG